MTAAVDQILARWDIDAVFNEPGQAQADGLRAIGIAARLGDRSRLAWCHLLVGGALASLSALTESASNLAAAMAIFREDGEAIGLAHTLLRSTLVSSPANDFERTILNLEEALAIARAEGDASLESKVLSDLAVATAEIGDVGGSMEHFHAALELAQRAGDTTTVAYIYNNIGSTLVDIGDTRGARPWLDDALAIAEANNNRAFLIYPLINLARCHDLDGDAPTALAVNERAQAVAASVSAPAFEAACWEAIGRLRCQLGDRHGAGKAFDAAHAIYAGLEGGSWPAKAAMAAWHAAAEDTPPSDELVIRLVSTLDRLNGDGTLGLQSKIHEVLAEASQRREDPTTALRHVRRHLDLERRIWQREVATRSQRLAAQMNIERTRRELDAERTRSDALSDANAQLEIANGRTAALLDELQRQTALLERQGIEDSLTGLFNRRHLDSELVREATRAGRFGHILSIAMVDIDHFKAINDRFSHQVGDQVLRAMSALFTDGLRTTDVVTRFGGEEFVFILPETSLSGAVTLVEQIRHAIEIADWSAIQPGLAVTVSAGIVSSRFDHSAPHLLACADAMLYLAKKRGRNQVRWREISESSRADAFRGELVPAPVHIHA